MGPTWIGVAVRIGHSTCERRGCFAVRARRRVSPSSVSALILAHLLGYAHSRERRIVVGVEAILLDFFPAGFFGVLALFALPPEKNSGDDEQSNDYYGNDNGNGGLSTAG